MGTRHHRTAGSVQTPGHATHITPKSHIGQMSSSQPTDGGKPTPNFLDRIEGFSDSVDFWLKCDQFAHDEEPVGSKVSEKKCRFCS